MHFSEEELIGSLKALFQATYQDEAISIYYNVEQIDQCRADHHCNEDVLRLRAVSAGVELLRRIYRFLQNSQPNGHFGVLYSCHTTCTF